MTSRIAVFVVTTGLLFVTGAATPQERGQGAAPAPGGQTPAPGRGRQSGPGYLKLFDSNMPFDPHDLAGIWSPNGNGFGGGGRCRDCGDRGYSFEFPVVHARGTGGLRQEHPFVRTRERQRRRQGASRRTHRPATGAAARARQRHLWHLQSDGHAARHSLSGSGRVHRPSRSDLSAFPVGIRSPNHLDRRPEAAEARRHRSAAMVGIRHRPLGGQHAGGRFDRIRRTNVDRLFRLSA